VAQERDTLNNFRQLLRVWLTMGIEVKIAAEKCSMLMIVEFLNDVSRMGAITFYSSYIVHSQFVRSQFVRSQ
jgi:uncharacterized membrane protein